VGEQEAEGAPRQREQETFEHQLTRDSTPARPERGSHGQLLLPPLRTDQEEVRDVRAGDQQHDAHRGEQDPQHRAHVADHVLGERTDPRAQPDVLEHSAREPRRGGEAVEHHRDHPGHVRVRLLDADPRLQPRDRLVAEVPDEHLGPVEAEGQQHVGVAVEEAKAARQDPDDLARLSVHDHLLPHRIGLRSERPLPVGVAQHHPFGRGGRVVFGRERPAQVGAHAQNREEGVADEERVDSLWIPAPCYRDRCPVPQGDVLEGTPLLPVGHVGGRSLVQQGHVDPGRGVPHGDQPVGLVVRERLEQHAVDDAEDGRARPDAQRERDHGDQREQRGTHEGPDGAANVLRHEVLPGDSIRPPGRLDGRPGGRVQPGTQGLPRRQRRDAGATLTAPGGRRSGRGATPGGRARSSPAGRSPPARSRRRRRSPGPRPRRRRAAPTSGA